MTIAYDYSGGRIPSAALIAAGVRTVMRYVSTPGNPKNITKAEYEELTAAGITVGLVYETTASWMLGGYSAGLAAARSARVQATAVGYPAAHRIWYAADFEASAAQISTVLDCLNGCAAADGGRAAGLADIYGDYDVVEKTFAAGYTAPWQTAAWSQGKRSNHAVLYQTTMQTTCAGVQVDINEVLAPLFSSPPAAKPATTTEEDLDMMCISVPNSATVAPTDAKDRQVWLLSPIAYVHLDSPSYASLMEQGVKTAHWTWAQHQAMLAATSHAA
jgi:hypothetical protein